MSRSNHYRTLFLPVLLAIAAPVGLVLAKRSHPAEPAPPGAREAAGSRAESARVERGSLLVLGQVFEGPMTLVKSASDVTVDGVSIFAALAEARAARANEGVGVSETSLVRHGIVAALAASYQSLAATLGGDGALERMPSIALNRREVRSAFLRGSGIWLTWEDGSTEEILFSAGGVPAAVTSTEARFHGAFSSYVRTLQSGGVVALGLNSIIEARGEPANALRGAIREALRDGVDLPRSQARLEGVTGGRALGAELLRAKR